MNKSYPIERMFDEIETCDEARRVMDLIDINNPYKYAKALLELKSWCWDIDPILIEEFWADKVSEFLKYLANNA